MSVTSLDFQNQYTTDGVSFSYPFTWTTVSQNEVTVYLNNTAQVLGTDFTVQLNPTGIGGMITFTAIPPANEALLIQRVDDFLQPNNFGNNQALPPQTLVQMFDKLTIMCQQLLQQSTLSLALSLPAAAAGVNATLPFPIVAGALIGWDNLATGTAYVDPVEAGFVLTDNGEGNLPSFQPATGGGGGGGGISVNPTSLPTFAGELVLFNNTLGTVVAGLGANGAAGTVLTSTGASSTPDWALPSSSLLKAANVPATALGLPTTGHIASGIYLHFGNWTQSGNITFDDSVYIYHNGALFTFVNGFTCVSTGSSITAASVNYTTPNASIPAPGGGIGGGHCQQFADAIVGGAGGGCGGIGGDAIDTTDSKRYPPWSGKTYGYRLQFSGSGGAGGGTTSATVPGGAGGKGGSGFYLETTGSIVFSTISNVPSISNNGLAGGAGGVQGAGGGGSGGIVVIRAAGTISGGNGTNTISCNGGTGGAVSSGFGGGGGGGGGIIDTQSMGAITATGFTVAGGVGGAGSSGGVAGAAGVSTVVGSVAVLMSVF